MYSRTFKPTSFVIDNDEPSPERQNDLRKTYRKNILQNKDPYNNTEIRTKGEVLWIIHEHNWRGHYYSKNRNIKEPINFKGARLFGNFSGAYFDEADLRDVSLQGDFSGVSFYLARLSHATLVGSFYGSQFNKADLERASIIDADMSETNFGSATMRRLYAVGVNFTGTVLEEADLTGSRLSRANLSNTLLTNAKLSGAWLDGTIFNGASLIATNLSSADMRGSHMDAMTLIDGEIILNPETKFGDILWNGASLTQIDWSSFPDIGDEFIVDEATNKDERIRSLRNVARAYNGLSVTLRAQGLFVYASHYRLKEQKFERLALLEEGQIGKWFFSWLLDKVSGYGEKPERTFAAYLTVVSTFAILFWISTNFSNSPTTALSWNESFVLSLVSFHGRGLFPSTVSRGMVINQEALRKDFKP